MYFPDPMFTVSSTGKAPKALFTLYCLICMKLYYSFIYYPFYI